MCVTTTVICIKLKLTISSILTSGMHEGFGGGWIEDKLPISMQKLPMNMKTFTLCFLSLLTYQLHVTTTFICITINVLKYFLQKRGALGGWCWSNYGQIIHFEVKIPHEHENCNFKCHIFRSAGNNWGEQGQTFKKAFF